MSNTTRDKDAQIYPAATRRERLERIAAAERDRRAGHAALAIAAIGEPIEWPARAVVALAKLSPIEPTGTDSTKPDHRSDEEARRVLEEGLDFWAREAGLGSLDAPPVEVEEDSVEKAAEVSGDEFEPTESDPLGLIADLTAMPADLETPFDAAELDRAFDSAEADVDAMRDVNEVAQRVLMHEGAGLGADSDASLTPVEQQAQESAYDIEPLPDTLGLDAASALDVSKAPSEENTSSESNADPQQQTVLVTLESWLRNIERRKLERGAS